jgi:hypothetical protein
MATKPDLKAQKERKQKIILAVGGVLLVGVLAMQLPKMLKHSSSTSAAPAPTVTTPDAATPTIGSTPAPSSPSAPVNVSASKTSAQLAGVVLSPATTPKAGQGQLWSFSRFKAKDPFVPQVREGSGSSGATTAASPSGGTTTSAGGTTASPGGTTAPAAPLAYATLLVNGRPQQLTLKQQFPKADPIFVLVKLVGENARIGVAGGSFTAGNTVLIQLGKKVTLMNTTTGQRYVVKLVYVGSTPETIAPFKAGNTAPATTTATSPTTTNSSATTAIPGTVP